jgi:hypothetical protein
VGQLQGHPEQAGHHPVVIGRDLVGGGQAPIDLGPEQGQPVQALGSHGDGPVEGRVAGGAEGGRAGPVGASTRPARAASRRSSAARDRSPHPVAATVAPSSATAATGTASSPTILGRIDRFPNICGMLRRRASTAKFRQVRADRARPGQPR